MSKTKLFILFFELSATANAQSFGKGQKDINIGIGLGSTYYSNTYNTNVPPLSFSYEVGITDDISLGGYFSFASASYKFTSSEFCNGGGPPVWYNYTDEYKYSYTILGLRGAYHLAKFIPHDNLDVYGGIMLGYDIVHVNYTSTSVCTGHYSAYGAASEVAFSFFLGTRYRFNDKLGIFGELGYGLSYLTIGLSIKM